MISPRRLITRTYNPYFRLTPYVDSVFNIYSIITNRTIRRGSREDVIYKQGAIAHEVVKKHLQEYD